MKTINLELTEEEALDLIDIIWKTPYTYRQELSNKLASQIHELLIRDEQEPVVPSKETQIVEGVKSGFDLSEFTQNSFPQE
tara:strand:- start:88040 stop:88282 length:243 start_codon:yes stop_codon:yes gene_type:complete